MATTYAQFKSKVRDLVHPSGIAKPLLSGSQGAASQFNNDILAALIHIQKYVPYYQSRNRDVIEFADTKFYCGSTVIPLPRGRIQRICTIEGGCCPIIYTHVRDFDVWMNHMIYFRPSYDEPENEGMPVLTEPYKFSEDVTDKGCRANYGFWSIKDKEIFISTYIESSESVVVEWHGIRRHYTDATVMPFDGEDELGVGDVNDDGAELLNAVAAFVRSEDLRKNRRDYEGALFERQVFDTLVAEMIHSDWAERTPKMIGDQFGELPLDQTVVGYCSADAGVSVVPDDALLDENNEPILDESNRYILIGGA